MAYAHVQWVGSNTTETGEEMELRASMTGKNGSTSINCTIPFDPTRTYETLRDAAVAAIIVAAAGRGETLTEEDVWFSLPERKEKAAAQAVIALPSFPTPLPKPPVLLPPVPLLPPSPWLAISAGLGGAALFQAIFFALSRYLHLAQ